VIVVSRPESSSAKTLPAGVKVISVELTDVSALAAAFTEHKIDVVISTVAHAGLTVSHTSTEAFLLLSDATLDHAASVSFGRRCQAGWREAVPSV